jgi:hypothetical protein
MYTWKCVILVRYLAHARVSSNNAILAVADMDGINAACG